VNPRVRGEVRIPAESGNPNSFSHKEKRKTKTEKEYYGGGERGQREINGHEKKKV
jgi:hypothetical protein